VEKYGVLVLKLTEPTVTTGLHSVNTNSSVTISYVKIRCRLVWTMFICLDCVLLQAVSKAVI